MRNLILVEKFSEYTGLRHCDISDNSGEEFYHNILNYEFKEALENNEKLTIDIDNADGFAPSFLDEAFGNLVFDFGLEKVKNNVIIVSTQEPHWKEMIEEKTYLQWENRRNQNDTPKKTEKHKPWFKLINNEFVLKDWIKPNT